jgi:uncharacterized protein (TIGR03437 family)
MLLTLLALVLCTGSVYASGSLAATNNPVSLAYVKNGPAVGSQTWASVNNVVISAADGASAYDFTISTTTPPPAWLTVAPGGGGHVDGTAPTTVALTITVNPSGTGFSTLPVGASAFSFGLAVGGTDDLTISGTILIQNTPLASSAPSIALSFVKGGSTAPTASASISVHAPITTQAFTVDPTSVPNWLTLTCPGACTGGNAPAGGLTVTFTAPTAVLSMLATGNYSKTVNLNVPGYATPLAIPVTLSISNTATGGWGLEDSTNTVLTVVNTTKPLVFAWGSTAPVTVVTPYATDEPVYFTATCTSVTSGSYVGSPCVLKNNQASTVTNGVAYSWGFPLNATVDPNYFTQAFGTSVTVTVSVTVNAVTKYYGYVYTITPNPPTIATITPTSAQPFTVGSSLIVMLTGTNFIGSQSVAGGLVPTQVWVAGSAANLTSANGTNISSSAVVIGGNTMWITVPGSALTNIAGSVYIGLANQTAASAPTAAATGVNIALKITANPVINSITNAASYTQPNLGTPPAFAPYELISLFGNFLPSGAIPNGGTIALNQPDAFSKFSSTLAISGTGSTAKSVTVSFYSNSTATILIGAAPLLFVTANQINAIVPSNVTVGTAYVTVNYNGTISDPFKVGIVAADPGVFTVASDGLGQGAVLFDHSGTWALNAAAAGGRATVGDTLSIYMTGLGTPNSATDDNSTVPSGSGVGTGCVYTKNAIAGHPGYMDVINALSPAPNPKWTTIDGAILQSKYLNVATGHFAPCLTSALPVTVTFYDPAGVLTAVPATATYAGFVADSVAGLYQVNVTIPASVTWTGDNIPVTVSVNGSTASPLGVTVAIQ